MTNEPTNKTRDFRETSKNTTHIRYSKFSFHALNLNILNRQKICQEEVVTKLPSLRLDMRKETRQLEIILKF